MLELANLLRCRPKDVKKKLTRFTIGLGLLSSAICYGVSQLPKSAIDGVDKALSIADKISNSPLAEVACPAALLGGITFAVIKLFQRKPHDGAPVGKIFPQQAEKNSGLSSETGRALSLLNSTFSQNNQLEKKVRKKKQEARQIVLDKAAAEMEAWKILHPDRWNKEITRLDADDPAFKEDKEGDTSTGVHFDPSKAGKGYDPNNPKGYGFFDLRRIEVFEKFIKKMGFFNED